MASVLADAASVWQKRVELKSHYLDGLSASAGDGPPPPPPPADVGVGVGVGVGVVNDISEADERMKRYYGILPKLQADKPAEIRGTVRPRLSFVFRSSATKLTEFC